AIVPSLVVLIPTKVEDLPTRRAVEQRRVHGQHLRVLRQHVPLPDLGRVGPLQLGTGDRRQRRQPDRPDRDIPEELSPLHCCTAPTLTAARCPLPRSWERALLT